MKKLRRWLVSRFPLQKQARFIAWLLPNRYWYRAALIVCGVHGFLVSLIGENGALTEALMLDHWLWELTASGAFPIPWVLNGADVIEAADPKIGTVYCWFHEPLAELPMRTYLESGYPEFAVLADSGRVLDGRFPIFGITNWPPALPSNRYALGRMKRSLVNGVPVMCRVDEYLGGPLVPYILQLAGLVGARVVFHRATMRPDRTIEVTFFNAPRPYCEDDEAVRENLAFLEEARQRALQSLGIVDKKLPEDLLKAVKTT